MCSRSTPTASQAWMTAEEAEAELAAADVLASW